MTEKPEYDENLWFELENCEGRHFLIGNPHTYKGRIDAYCPIKNTTFCISYKEIKKMSIESKYWLQGYLSGNEPDPPEEYDGESAVDFFQSMRYKEWELKFKSLKKQESLMDDFNTISWIFLSIHLGSQKSPIKKNEIRLIADGINHSNPTDNENQHSIMWLLDKGLILKEKDGYISTEKGNLLIKKAEIKSSKTILSIWENLSSEIERKNKA